MTIDIDTANRNGRNPRILLDQDAYQEAVFREILVSEMGDWLGSADWSHAGTFTFEHPISPTKAMEKGRALKRRLEQRSQGKVDYFLVAEGVDPWRVHLHALLKVQRLNINAVKGAWRGGQSDVESYDGSRGWSHYICKDLFRPGTEWDCSFSVLE